MDILADTHIMIWFFKEPEKLSKKAKELLLNKSNNIYYMQWSAIADRRKFFEIIYKDKENLYLKRKYYKILNKLK